MSNASAYKTIQQYHDIGPVLLARGVRLLIMTFLGLQKAPVHRIELIITAVPPNN